MGLSSDPEKKRRQLLGLAKGAESRAARLRAMAAELEPGSIVAQSEAVNDAPPAPASEAHSEAPGARLVRGSYGDLPAAPAPAVEPEEDDLEDDLEPADEPGPSGLTKFAAGALGVKR